MQPSIVVGNSHQDQRGVVKYNNSFNTKEIKRLYLIENNSLDFERGWQGHKIEQRWFSAVSGKFAINVIKIVDWENPDVNLEPLFFEISDEKLDVLYVSGGFITCIKALEENSKLLVMSDYLLGEIDDDYRFPLEMFERKYL